MNILLPLFASNIMVSSIEEDTSELDIKDFEIVDSGTSGQRSGASDNYFVLKKYPKIEKLILEKFKYFTERMRYSNEFRITTSWITEMKRGDYSQKHNHKNSFYSGVYYFDKYEDKSGNIVFQSPVADFQDFFISPKEFTIENSTSWSVEPEKGRLIFFPSYLKHMIMENYGETPRYSLAFNIVPVGEYGVADSTYSTSWFKM